MSQNPNVRVSDLVAVLGRIAPISQAAGTATSGWIDASQYPQLAAILETGVLGASATVDAKFQQATDSSGTNAKDITGAAITQIVKGGSSDGKEAIVNLRAEALDINNGFNYVQFSITVGTAASLVGALIVGVSGRYGAVQDSTVVQTVTV